MTTSYAEKFNSRRQFRGPNPAQEVAYIVMDAADDTAAQNFLIAELPKHVDVGGIIVPMTSVDSEALADTIFECTVKWGAGNTNVVDPEEQTVSFDTSGGKAKITHSMATVSYPAPGKNAPNHHNAIGVTKTGIEGVEVVVPALTFSFKRSFPAELVTPDYIKTVAYLTGKYNNAPFATFAEGEVRFDGASGDQKMVGANVDITFKFTVEQNRTGLAVAGITGITKKGWQYLWVESEEYEDTSSNQLSRQTLAVHIEDIPNLEPADFTQLGIGT